MHPIKTAIMGAGRIAQRMADTLRRMDCIELYAIAARDQERAQQFASEYGIARAYGSYEAMLADPEIELVYIATPNALHASQMLACLCAGKHVLCEKSFTTTAPEAGEVLSYAREHHLVAAEAIWPRYMPMAATIRDICESGRIGKIHGLTATLGYPVYYKSRVQALALGGGALLDVGIYALTFAAIALGHDVKRLSTSAVMSDTGVDLQHTISLVFGDGQMATLHGTVLSSTDRGGAIYGESGYAIVDNINNFESVRIFSPDHRMLEQIERPLQLTGFEYEVQAVVDAIRAGESECPQMPHAEIVRMMELMDNIRGRWGMLFPWEGEQKEIRG